MIEKIYTIPVNEAFSHKGGCPMCSLYNMQQEKELEKILGAAMMEPDVRIETNRLGFCNNHYNKLLARKNKLSLALIIQSHLDLLKGMSYSKKSISNKEIDYLNTQKNSCYICSKTNEVFKRFVFTVLSLYKTEKEFRNNFLQSEYICVEHSAMLLSEAKKMSKKDFESFCSDLKLVNQRYADKLSEDIDWFCRKFDYRFKDEDWKDSKDSVERAIKFLSGDN